MFSLSEYIEKCVSDEERGLIICQDDEESQKVSNFLEKNNVPHKIAQNMESSCNIFVLQIYHFNSSFVLEN